MKKQASADLPDFRIINGDFNLGVWANGVKALFSKDKGGLISLKYGDRELIKQKPRLTFWRALTDNDRGAGYGFDMAMWENAGKFAKQTDFKLELTETGARISYDFLLPVGKDLQVKVAYTVDRTGTIGVKASSQEPRGCLVCRSLAWNWPCRTTLTISRITARDQKKTTLTGKRDPSWESGLPQPLKTWPDICARRKPAIGRDCASWRFMTGKEAV